jgi:hypothetical protein
VAAGPAGSPAWANRGPSQPVAVATEDTAEATLPAATAPARLGGERAPRCTAEGISGVSA